MPQDDLKQIISQVAEEKAGEEEKKIESLQVLVFELDGEEYAVNIIDLREIITIPEITPIPNSPKFIRGILNLRGQIVVVIDLEKRFDLVRENKIKSKHIIVTQVQENDFGVMVDNVKEVLTIPTDKVRPTPDLVSTKVHADYLSGVIVLGGEEDEGEKNDQQESRLIVILDLPKLLQDKELLQLGKTIKKTTHLKEE
ncbi:chemotaxis protein CheW [Candidatus Parcubacteria bacterium]|nr:MAG: chemotaxis protein CheW [Candidatus Parcubacteria bacterium]